MQPIKLQNTENVKVQIIKFLKPFINQSDIKITRYSSENYYNKHKIGPKIYFHWSLKVEIMVLSSSTMEQVVYCMAVTK